MYKLLYSKINSKTNEQIGDMYCKLPDVIKQRVDNKNTDFGKKSSILAYNLAVENLNEICACALSFDRDKPVCDVGYISISHSRSHVFCVLSELPVGVDAEQIRKFDFSKVISRLTEEERAYINDNVDRFFKVWTVKESYAKCVGCGVGAVLSKGLLNQNGDAVLDDFSFITQIIEDNVVTVCVKKF